jgi:hypothetical protein
MGLNHTEFGKKNINNMTTLKTFEHPKHKGLFVEQLYFGGHDIRYRVVGSDEIMPADAFFEKYGSTLVE